MGPFKILLDICPTFPTWVSTYCISLPFILLVKLIERAKIMLLSHNLMSQEVHGE